MHRPFFCLLRRELYTRFFNAFEPMGEPNIPVDRQMVQARAVKLFVAGLPTVCLLKFAWAKLAGQSRRQMPQWAPG